MKEEGARPEKNLVIICREEEKNMSRAGTSLLKHIIVKASSLRGLAIGNNARTAHQNMKQRHGESLEIQYSSNMDVTRTSMDDRKREPTHHANRTMHSDTSTESL